MADAYFIAPQQSEYKKYCSSTAPPDKLAICINDPFDIRNKILDTSPGLVGVMTDNVQSDVNGFARMSSFRPMLLT